LKRLFGISLFILFVAVMSACNNNEKADGEAVEPTNEQEEHQSTPADKSVSSVTGDEVFQKSCISCHSSGDISGGHSKLDSAAIQSNFKTREELLSYVSERMPMSAPGSLSAEEYEAVVKYLWKQK